METVCLYRKWRSRTFDELVGQEHITTTLQNAVLEGRLAHAYLFAGPRGTGKTSTAKLLAKLLNCTNRPPDKAEPCNECSLCRQITRGHSMDIIEIDAASNRGIDEIRDLREKIKFAPAEALYKVYIIDEVHMLTTEAFNALLKTLEEPPPRTIFVLATTEPNKLLPTVVSRCQRFDFKRLGIETIIKRMENVSQAEGFSITSKALTLLAQAASGSLRDALSLLDQVVAFNGTDITEVGVTKALGMSSRGIVLQLSRAIEEHNAGELLNIIDTAIADGADLSQLLVDLTAHYRGLLLLNLGGEDTHLVTVSEEERRLLITQVKNASPETFIRAIKILGEIKNELRWNDQGRIAAEMGLLRLTLSDSEPTVESLKQRISQLDQRLNLLEQRTPKTAAPATQPRATNTNSPSPFEPPLRRPLVLDKTTHSAGPALSLKYEEIVDRWHSFLELLKAEKRTLHAVLVEGSPSSWNGNILNIVFPESWNFHKETVEEQAAILEKVFKTCFGVTGKIVPILKNISPKLEHKEGNSELSANEHETAVQNILEVFGGTIQGE